MRSFDTPRKQAKSSGQKFYQATKPCSKGHTAPRYVSNGACVECLKQSNAAIRERKLVNARSKQLPVPAAAGATLSVAVAP